MTNQVLSNSNFSANSTTSSAGDDWSAAVTVTESGLDGYGHLVTLGYVRDAEGNYRHARRR